MSPVQFRFLYYSPIIFFFCYTELLFVMYYKECIQSDMDTLKWKAFQISFPVPKKNCTSANVKHGFLALSSI